MSPREDHPLETRAERRRRLRALEEQATPDLSSAPAPGPYDPHPYGVHAYTDIEDAVVEYEESPRAPREYVADLPDLVVAEARPMAYPDEHDLPSVQAARLPAAYPDGPDYHDLSRSAQPSPAPYPDELAPSSANDLGLPAATTRTSSRADGQNTSYDGRRAGDPLDLPAPAQAGSIHPASPSAASPAHGTPRNVTPERVTPERVGLTSRLDTAGLDDLLETHRGTTPAPRPVPLVTETPATAAPTTTPAAPTPQSPPKPAAQPVAPSAPHDASIGRSAPLESLAQEEDPASAAAALQIIAARAAAERLMGTPRPAVSDKPAAATRPVGPDRAERERLAAERIAADRVAAARLAAVRVAAQRGGAERKPSRPAIAAAPAGHAGASPSATSPSASSAGAPTADGSLTAATETPGAAKAGSSSPRVSLLKVPVGGLLRPRAGGPRRPGAARIAYPLAAVAVLGLGAIVTVPALVSTASPSAAPGSTSSTGAAAQPGSAPQTAPAGASPTSAAAAGSDALACDPASWSSRIAGDGSAAAAVNEFTPDGVAEAYCATAGTLRSLSFTDLAVRRPANRPYTATDFAPIAEHLSPGLRTQWNNDVADFVKSQDLRGAAGRRISALTRLAWDNSALRWDPSAAQRAGDFAVGRPVTWTAKGADGVTRLGLGFETGIVTHMLDAAGRPQGQILKRTYRFALIKGDQAHPWLIDAYQVSEATAKLSTTTVAPTAKASTAG